MRVFLVALLSLSLFVAVTPFVRGDDPSPSLPAEDQSSPGITSVSSSSWFIRSQCPIQIARMSRVPFADFSGHVAHAIHSMTVEDLRLFDPNVTVDNMVPTISMNLSSEWAILDHAPNVPPNAFHTTGMKMLDRVLSHMDNRNWDVRGFSVIERIVHALHMAEIWSMVRMEYQTLVTETRGRKETLSDVCACVKDIHSNGILKALRFIALGIREPGLVYDGRPVKNDDQRESSPLGPAYDIPYSVVYNVTYHFLGDGQEQLLSPTETLKDQSESMPRLVGESSWKVWKGLLTGMDHTAHRSTALFIFCILP